ncbi:hypothetical protein O181_060324 [Austropuccinia psidii MF-1]|uniref:Uncharacterized protein n=1 Tax=Austropuccinia psidii MF-1 TaxID=1389203 RepID=A0A9Q3EG51_9BASI|nr:hypothetical protein [Austropuccinia psidii MF-1]
MLLKDQTHFNTICKVREITPHGARQQFGMRRLLPHRLIIEPLYHSYSHTCIGFRIPAQYSLTLSMLTCPHRPPNVTPTLPPISTLTTPYAITPPPLNMLMLPRHPQDMPPTLPLPLLTPSTTHLILSNAYHPYACVVPSQHAYDTNLTPASSSTPPTILMLL